ncbi:sugar transporter family protein (ISS) [Dorcoceras hygrometricum]|uniref:Sugar transporter family protein (ISS) n=1 Tax=Dorcoceras hygrometricum TaxID=472368 RepID=A0A2Z7B2J0_9LAMI|nr:sugar transporter family protein (ISS) [Dorcoceras hygrometricum]
MEQGQASNTGALDEKNRAKLVKVKPAQAEADRLGEENQIGEIWSSWMLMKELMMGKQKAHVVEKVTNLEGNQLGNKLRSHHCTRAAVYKSGTRADKKCS